MEKMQEDAMLAKIDNLEKKIEELKSLTITLYYTYNEKDQSQKRKIQDLEKRVINWIPVSERLPEKDGKYLWNYGDGELLVIDFKKGINWRSLSEDTHASWAEIKL